MSRYFWNHISNQQLAQGVAEVERVTGRPVRVEWDGNLCNVMVGRIAVIHFNKLNTTGLEANDACHKWAEGYYWAKRGLDG